MEELPHIQMLTKAIKDIKISDHMIYVTYPVIKDKRLLMKALDQVYESIVSIINSILQYDFLNKRLELYKEPRANWDSFVNKCSRRYNITPEEITVISELFSLVESHKKSPIEFQRKDKIVIMSDSLKTTLIDSEKLKKYLNLAKNLVNKAKFGMSIQ